VEGFTAQGTGDRSIRTDQPQVKAELLGDWQGKRVPTAGNQDDLYAFVVSAAQGRHIRVGNLKLGIEQGAVDVDGQEANGKRH